MAGSSPAWPIAAKTSYSLPNPQLPIFLPAKSSGRGDVLLDEADLQGAGALVDLRDVHDVGTRLTAGERLGHPCQGEVDVAVRELGLRHDLDAAFHDRDIETHVLVEPLVLRGEVPGELRLGEPLELQADRNEFFTLAHRVGAIGRLGSSALGGRRLRTGIVVTPARRQQRHGDEPCSQIPDPLLAHVIAPPGARPPVCCCGCDRDVRVADGDDAGRRDGEANRSNRTAAA